MHLKLRNTPMWVWLLLTLALNYAIYNPFGGMSIYHLWTKTNGMIAWSDSAKFLMTAAVIITLLLVMVATYMALRLSGLVVLMLLIGGVLWVLHQNGLLDVTNPSAWKYLPQPLLAVVWTVGLQWPKIKAAITGQLTTDDVESSGA